MTKKYGKSGRRSKERLASERGRERERESSCIEDAPISYRVSVSWDITGCGPPKYAAFDAAFDDAPPSADRILRFPEKVEVSRASSLERPTSTYRPHVDVCERKAARWSLFRDHFPRVPLAPNWNWPLHPINSLCLARWTVSRVAFVLFRVLPSRVWSLEGSGPMISQEDYGYSRRKTERRMITGWNWKSTRIWSMRIEVCFNFKLKFLFPRIRELFIEISSIELIGSRFFTLNKNGILENSRRRLKLNNLLVKRSRDFKNVKVLVKVWTCR